MGKVAVKYEITADTETLKTGKNSSNIHLNLHASLSIEQMLASNPGKTPISLLQEYGTRIGKTPVYDLLKAEGQAHQPNFTFRVTVGDISCTG